MTPNFSIILRISPHTKGAGAKIVGKVNEGNIWYVRANYKDRIIRSMRGTIRPNNKRPNYKE